MIVKSLEFKNVVGQKLKVMDIPVMTKDNPYYLLIQSRLQTFINALYKDKKVKSCYSFRDYLKRVLKWPVYEEIYKPSELKNNA